MNVKITWKEYVAIALAVLMIFSAIPSTGYAQAGPTPQNCYSAQFHASTDCDRLASQNLITTVNAYIAVTGGGHAPALRDCYSPRFHAASDCDRIAWDTFRR